MIPIVLVLGDTYTSEFMFPRTAMITIDHDVPLRKAMSLFLRSGFSRIPVVRESEDDIVGILYFKDVVRRLHADPEAAEHTAERDRKSTRLNSSHVAISYAVFCLKKKKTRRTATA